MPSPIAHGLAGLVLARLVRHVPDGHHSRWLPLIRRVETRRAALLMTGALMFAASAPDLDFLAGILLGDADRFHRGLSHSLLAAVLFGAAAGLVSRVAGLRSAGRLGLVMGLAFASHSILDAFTADPRRFNGVPLLWPLWTRHVMVPWPVFLNIDRDPAATGFFASLLLPHNVHAILRECLVMGAVLVLCRPGGGPARMSPRAQRSNRSSAMTADAERGLDSPS